MNKLFLPLVAWLIFLAAAALEVGGDAIIRKGLRGGGWPWIAAGGCLLAVYGMTVNAVKWDFSKLIGVYVGVFALTSVLVGRIAFNEQVPLATWVGLAIILLGGAVIQFGSN
jgi:drug/metabolite transporter superfamily protein YnfA